MKIRLFQGMRRREYRCKRYVGATEEALVRQHPKSLPRGEGGLKGRVRNAGGNPKDSTNEQTSS